MHPHLLLGLTVLLATPMSAQQADRPVRTAHQERRVTTIARGTFDVKMGPLPSDEVADAAQIGRFSIDKTLHGDLEGTSKGQMLATGAPASGSAGYVAIERFTGTLNGRQGSFSLQHTAWMAGGEQSMTITVVPDSGTEELTGLKGTLLIIIAGKDHSYEFTYSLPAAP